MKLIDVNAAMYRWLKKANIDPEGFRLVLSFPDSERKFQAECQVKSEMDMNMIAMSDLGLSFNTRQFQLHGLDTRFEDRRGR